MNKFLKIGINSLTDASVSSGGALLYLDWGPGGPEGILINSAAMATYFGLRIHYELTDKKGPRLQLGAQALFQFASAAVTYHHTGANSKAFMILILSAISNGLMFLPKRETELESFNTAYALRKFILNPYSWCGVAFMLAGNNNLANIFYGIAVVLTVVHAMPKINERFLALIDTGFKKIKNGLFKRAQSEITRKARSAVDYTTNYFSSLMRETEFPLILMASGCAIASMSYVALGDVQLAKANALYGLTCLSIYAIQNKKYGGVAEYLESFTRSKLAPISNNINSGPK